VTQQHTRRRSALGTETGAPAVPSSGGGGAGDGVLKCITKGQALVIKRFNWFPCLSCTTPPTSTSTCNCNPKTANSSAGQQA
jgi:hypothetical protein